MRTRTTIALLSVVFVLAGCGFQVVVGSGHVEDRTTTFEGLRGVQAGASFDVEVVRGDTASVTVTADSNVMDHVVVEEVDGVLRLGLRDRVQVRDATLEAVVTVQRIEELRASGSATLLASDSGPADRTTVRTSGTGDVTAAGIDADHLDVHASGSSTMELAGAARQVDLRGSGSSRVGLTDLRVGDVDVSLSGSARADVTFDGRGAASLSGSSELTVGGDGDLVDRSTTGSSSIERR